MEPLRDADGSLERAILDALDELLRALELESLGGDRFRAACEPGRFDRVFGGQLLAQSLLAAHATVTGKSADSLHAYFAGAGTPEHPLDLEVERVRDGRSTSLRRVAVTQSGRPLLVAMAAFDTNPTSPRLVDRAPHAPAPEELPLLQHWALHAPDELRADARCWVDQPPPLELRIGEPPSFMGGSSAGGTRAHWMRLPRDITENHFLHAALLAYASDYLLLDMAFRSYPEAVAATAITGLSLDHAIWFHRPVRFDGWHLHTQETLAISGDRGLIRGSIHDARGHLVASVMQEVLVRAAR